MRAHCIKPSNTVEASGRTDGPIARNIADHDYTPLLTRTSVPLLLTRASYLWRVRAPRRVPPVVRLLIWSEVARMLTTSMPMNAATLMFAAVGEGYGLFHVFSAERRRKGLGVGSRPAVNNEPPAG
jgi:hypothetical protein